MHTPPSRGQTEGLCGTPTGYPLKPHYNPSAPTWGGAGTLTAVFRAAPAHEPPGRRGGYATAPNPAAAPKCDLCDRRPLQ